MICPSKASYEQGGADESKDFVCSLDPIGLAEIDKARLTNRVDSKFVFNDALFSELLEAVSRHYRILTIDNTQLFAYRTLYLDTAECECYLHHHNGKLTRRKFRIREYVSTHTRFLEVKSKFKRRTIKERIPIEQFEMSLSPASVEFINSVTGDSLKLTPQLWTNFSRITLVNREFPERVTMDVGLDFARDDLTKAVPGIVIAEVKQERDNRHSPIRVALRALGVRPMRISKYCIGSVLLNPGLKYNRFKPKLIAIQRIAGRNGLWSS